MLPAVGVVVSTRRLTVRRRGAVLKIRKLMQNLEMWWLIGSLAHDPDALQDCVICNVENLRLPTSEAKKKETKANFVK